MEEAELVLSEICFGLLQVFGGKGGQVQNDASDAAMEGCLWRWSTTLQKNLHAYQKLAFFQSLQIVVALAVSAHCETLKQNKNFLER